MYAVIQTGGKQYRVSEGDVITVDRVQGEPGDSIVFSKVILLENAGKLQVISTEIKDVKVTGKIIGNKQGKKIRVFRYRRRKNTMKTKGSRPKYTSISIEKIITA
jgi:large subunit ribosomal protein L21